MKPLLEPVLLDRRDSFSSSGPVADRSPSPLSAPLTLSFDYTRSVGPTLSRFFTLACTPYCRGARLTAESIKPPVEYDPVGLRTSSEMYRCPARRHRRRVLDLANPSR